MKKGEREGGCEGGRDEASERRRDEQSLGGKKGRREGTLSEAG